MLYESPQIKWEIKIVFKKLYVTELGLRPISTSKDVGKFFPVQVMEACGALEVWLQ
jgi:hypothetical protein